MYLWIHNRKLLRGMMAGAIAVAGASACSRSDRAQAGRDTTQMGAVTPADTQANPSAQPSTAAQPTTGTQPSSVDTATPTPSGDTSKASRTARTTPAKTGDQDVAGYKAMGQDTSTASSNAGDSAQVSAAVSQPTDTSSNTEVIDTAVTTSDTAATEMAGAVAPMTRDTSVALAQGDTATIGDTAVILTQADTTQQAEVALGNEGVGNEADTAATANDSTAAESAERVHPDTVSQKADELAKHEPDRVRPPEDSTEFRGNVTTDRAEANADAAPVGAAGVASTGNIATGADAVALMTRQGVSCMVPASDENRDLLWDMASSPSSLNPCGTGTMTLPKIWTGEKK
jgi:hypothetical protein